MKATTVVEYQGKQVDDKAIINRAKELWAAAGNKIKDIASMNLYVKPEENTVYYVINDTFTGNFSID